MRVSGDIAFNSQGGMMKPRQKLDQLIDNILMWMWTVHEPCWMRKSERLRRWRWER